MITKTAMMTSIDSDRIPAWPDTSRMDIRVRHARGRWPFAILCGLVLLPALATAAESPLGPAPIVSNGESPFAMLRSVDLPSVRWTDGFWADRHRQTAEVTLYRTILGSDYNQSMSNRKLINLTINETMVTDQSKREFFEIQQDKVKELAFW